VAGQAVVVVRLAIQEMPGPAETAAMLDKGRIFLIRVRKGRREGLVEGDRVAMRGLVDQQAREAAVREKLIQAVKDLITPLHAVKNMFREALAEVQVVG